MKCQEFEANVVEVLRGGVSESQRARALAHAAGCERCAALLEAERRLSENLLALAASQANEQAPARVEQQLVAAFRAQERPVASGLWQVGAGLHGPQATSNKPLVARWMWVAAAAGVVLLVVLLHGLLRNPRAPASNAARTAPRQESPAPLNAKREARPPAVASGQNVQANAPRQAKNPARRSPKTAPPAVVTELATDFFTVPYSEPLRPEESRRIVRVQVPRSTLATFGLPVNAEWALEPIQADVLVGEDNLARAIRFVGTWRPAPAPPVPATRPGPANVRFVR
jgi:hypothetical protein